MPAVKHSIDRLYTSRCNSPCQTLLPFAVVEAAEKVAIETADFGERHIALHVLKLSYLQEMPSVNRCQRGSGKFISPSISLSLVLTTQKGRTRQLPVPRERKTPRKTELRMAMRSFLLRFPTRRPTAPIPASPGYVVPRHVSYLADEIARRLACFRGVHSSGLSY
jgi:hypothetical protein